MTKTQQNNRKDNQKKKQTELKTGFSFKEIIPRADLLELLKKFKMKESDIADNPLKKKA